MGTTPDLKSVQTGLGKNFSQTGLFQISGKNIFFAGRFVPGKINFFESVLTSNTKDHMELYPLVWGTRLPPQNAKVRSEVGPKQGGFFGGTLLAHKR